MRILSNAFTYCFTSLSYYLPRRIPFQPMNYKDALTHPINTKLTKAKLIEICHSLQDHCLVDELTEPELITWDMYKKDFFNRMAIHNYEIKEVIKDVRNCVSFTADTYKDFRKHFDSLQIGNDLSNT